MKRTLIIAITMLLIAATMNGQKKSTVVNLSIDSEVLSKAIDYTVILPPGYNENQDKSYPVLYLLHGMYGINTDWVKNGNADKESARIMKEWGCKEMIIVTPNAGGADPVTQQNGYFDLPDWPYEQFFFTEFIPYIEKEFRTIHDKGHRAIAGLSTGGGGSLSYAMRHPEMFCAVYAMSAWAALTAEKKNAGYETAKGKVAPLLKSVNEHDCIEFIKRANPETVEALKTIKWFIDCGDDDFLLDVNLSLYQAFRQKGIPCQLRVRDGVHDWEYWHTALATCLPFVSINFE